MDIRKGGQGIDNRGQVHNAGIDACRWIGEDCLDLVELALEGADLAVLANVTLLQVGDSLSVGVGSVQEGLGPTAKGQGDTEKPSDSDFVSIASITGGGQVHLDSISGGLKLIELVIELLVGVVVIVVVVVQGTDRRS